MRDIELYRHLLGIELPWTVAKVELSVQEKRVDIWVEHGEGLLWACPECGLEFPLYDHAEERAWRHLDSCQFQTILHARPPRVECGLHGVKQVKLPWAEPRSRFTMLFERLAIDVLREAGVSGATRILGITWDEAWRLMERAVERGLMAKEKYVSPAIGVDEKSIAKGQRYFTIVCDLKRATVEYIGDGRKQASLDAYFEGLGPAQREGIKAVAMDMWEPFVNSVSANVPNGAEKIVFDKYHIMDHVGTAVDTVRKRENRALLKIGDDTLTGTKYLWLYADENLPDQKRDLFEHLKTINLKTGRAWAIKESLRGFWNHEKTPVAQGHWKKWYFWATHSKLPPIIEKARMLKRHLANVMTYFTHRITNALSEGVNSVIETIKKRACGFRNEDHFRTAIYFHCGGLQLYPVTH